MITQTNTRAKIARQNCHYTRVRTAGSKNLPPPHAGISPSTTTEKEPEKKKVLLSLTPTVAQKLRRTRKRKRSLSVSLSNFNGYEHYNNAFSDDITNDDSGYVFNDKAELDMLAENSLVTIDGGSYQGVWFVEVFEVCD